MKKTLYEILGVEPNAGPEEINTAYQQAIEKFDQNVSRDPNERVMLREAFQVLSNQQKRSFYDISLKNKAPDKVIVSAAEYEGTQTNWQNWIIGVLLVVAVAGWWVANKSSRAPSAPATVVQPSNASNAPRMVRINQPNDDTAA
ncbi:MAG TPA: DnaJ domain-containing protein, partial [Burkholderiaceae bacterium]|nr:DnaJ domain-containing protein [Burkholderiaceae bacterium]